MNTLMSKISRNFKYYTNIEKAKNKHLKKRSTNENPTVKKYLVDTNVLFNNPETLEKYNVVIPSHVLREVEHLELTRKQDRTLQWQIRRFKRILDENPHYHVDLNDYKFDLREDWDGQYTDNVLVQICVEEGYGIISNDRLLRDKCRLYGVEVVDVEVDDFIEHKGFKEVYLIKSEVDDIYANLSINRYNLIVNEYVVIYDDVNTERLDVLDIFKWDGKSMISMPRNRKGDKISLDFKTDQFGSFKPKDEHQMMVVDSIFSNKVTSIRGRAGSGKSLIALNTAWHYVEKYGYKLVIFVNPVPSMNAQELGFYTGGRLEKLLQSSVGTMLKSKFGDEFEIMSQIQNGKLDILPFVDLRGFDTGDKTIVWVLEAQNLTAELLKLGLQRIGDGSKVIIDGDFHQQIDKDVYSTDSGMKRMSEVFRGDELYGEIELQNVHRSRIAELADKM